MAVASLPPEVACESAPCPLGCLAGDVAVLTGRDRFNGLPGEFTVVRCRGCGLLRTSPRPTPETMGFYYPDSYQPYQATRVAVVPAGPLTPGHSPAAGRGEVLARGGSVRRWVRDRFQFHIDTLPPITPGRMLEVGCASGAYLHRLAQQGWDVAGVEFSPSAAAAARALGHPVHQGPLETAPDPPEPYDLIVGWMVLEHLHQPVEALRKLAGWLKPNGWLVLSVPNTAAVWRAWFGNRSYDWSLPMHLFHFTPATLKMVLAAGGWRVERILHQRVLGSLTGSLGFVMQDWGLQGPARWLLSLPSEPRFSPFVMFPAAWPLALLGQTGRMTVWARLESRL